MILFKSYFRYALAAMGAIEEMMNHLRSNVFLMRADSDVVYDRMISISFNVHLAVMQILITGHPPLTAADAGAFSCLRTRR